MIKVNPPFLNAVLPLLSVLGNVPTTRHGGLDRLDLILDGVQLVTLIRNHWLDDGGLMQFMPLSAIGPRKILRDLPSKASFGCDGGRTLSNSFRAWSTEAVSETCGKWRHISVERSVWTPLSFPTKWRIDRHLIKQRVVYHGVPILPLSAALYHRVPSSRYRAQLRWFSSFSVKQSWCDRAKVHHCWLGASRL